jgi:hypothetical protein
LLRTFPISADGLCGGAFTGRELPGFGPLFSPGGIVSEEAAIAGGGVAGRGVSISAARSAGFAHGSEPRKKRFAASPPMPSTMLPRSRNGQILRFCRTTFRLG